MEPAPLRRGAKEGAAQDDKMTAASAGRASRKALPGERTPRGSLFAARGRTWTPKGQAFLGWTAVASLPLIRRLRAAPSPQGEGFGNLCHPCPAG